MPRNCRIHDKVNNLVSTSNKQRLRSAGESTIFITEDKRVDVVWIHYFISS